MFVFNCRSQQGTVGIESLTEMAKHANAGGSVPVVGSRQQAFQQWNVVVTHRFVSPQAFHHQGVIVVSDRVGPLVQCNSHIKLVSLLQFDTNHVPRSLFGQLKHVQQLSYRRIGEFRNFCARAVFYADSPDAAVFVVAT